MAVALNVIQNTTTSVELDEPITQGDEQISIVEVRTPNMGDVRKHGLPFNLTADGEMADLKVETCMRYLQDLTCLPPSTLNMLNFYDFQRVMEPVMNFFKHRGSKHKKQ